MPHESADHRAASRAPSSARTKLLVSFAAGIAGGAVAAAAGAGRAAPLIGWDILALAYGSWVWATVWRLDAASADYRQVSFAPRSAIVLGSEAAGLSEAWRAADIAAAARSTRRPAARGARHRAGPRRSSCPCPHDPPGLVETTSPLHATAVRAEINGDNLSAFMLASRKRRNLLQIGACHV